jgi:hypothetical protein
VPIVGSLYVQAQKRPEIYRVRITVLDPARVPVDAATVWSSIGGEPKKVAGGWQFDIPFASKPADGKLVVYAKVENTPLTGETALQLADDYNPAATIVLGRDDSATVRGIVIDDSGAAVQGVSVSVIGYGVEAVITGADGEFSVPAHAAKGEMVRLHAQKEGYVAVNQDHPAGGMPATVVLNPKEP